MPNHARNFIGSRYIVRQLKEKVVKANLKKILIGRKSQALGTM